MEIKITSKKENELLERSEIIAEVNFTGTTPSRKQLTEELAKKLSAKPELISISKIKQLFGTKHLEMHAQLYKSQEAMQKLQPEYIKKRLEGKKEAQK
ncbi:MAG: 30S ribosomal protein S24e [Candidatus Woesearchaeota archaeon]